MKTMPASAIWEFKFRNIQALFKEYKEPRTGVGGTNTQANQNITTSQFKQVIAMPNSCSSKCLGAGVEYLTQVHYTTKLIHVN